MNEKLTARIAELELLRKAWSQYPCGVYWVQQCEEELCTLRALSHSLSASGSLDASGTVFTAPDAEHPMSTRALKRLSKRSCPKAGT
jgi:hypothetical protein